MAECKLCGKKLSFFDGKTLENNFSGYNATPSIVVCSECLPVMNRLKEGDMDAYIAVHDMINSRKDQALEAFVSIWEVVPDEAKKLEKDKLQQLAAQEKEEKKKKKEKEEEQRLQREREERERADKAIANAGGYWEYKVVSLIDDNGGGISSAVLESTMNSLGSYGWHLKVAYANELGRNSSSSGAYGVSSGTNETIDQNILIFERFVKV